MNRNFSNLLNFRFLFLFSLLIPFLQLSAEKAVASPLLLSEGDPLARLEFKERHIDLGKVKRGENIKFYYEFTNTGEVDVAIDFISGCDCTELDWPIKTFKPGESGKIEVVFLSAKKEKSETVEIDVLLKNLHPETKNPMLEILSYSYTF
jgi:hypothetical protein